MGNRSGVLRTQLCLTLMPQTYGTTNEDTFGVLCLSAFA